MITTSTPAHSALRTIAPKLRTSVTRSRINTKGGLEFENTAPLPSKLQNSSQADDIQTYLSLIQYSDEALRELIEHYKSIDEPTMIVFFGDHQPSLKRIIRIKRRKSSD